MPEVNLANAQVAEAASRSLIELVGTSVEETKLFRKEFSSALSAQVTWGTSRNVP